MLKLLIESRSREEIIDVTSEAQRLVAAQGWRDGALHLFCAHTTCGLTINERADPAVKRDLIKFFRAVAPERGGWEHGEGNSDAHIRASLLGASLLIPVEQGALVLGAWQGLFLYEGDGPRRRSILVQFLLAQ